MTNFSKKRREELRSMDGAEPTISITMSAEDLNDRREKARARNKQLLQVKLLSIIRIHISLRVSHS